jgi:hypothetical protein
MSAAAASCYGHGTPRRLAHSLCIGLIVLLVQLIGTLFSMRKSLSPSIKIILVYICEERVSLILLGASVYAGQDRTYLANRMLYSSC